MMILVEGDFLESLLKLNTIALTCRVALVNKNFYMAMILGALERCKRLQMPAHRSPR